MKIAIMGNQTIGTPTEIEEVLHGHTMPIIVNGLPENTTFTIVNTYIKPYETFERPITRAERRILKRKSK
jgi:hypothetical protein